MYGLKRILTFWFYAWVFFSEFCQFDDFLRFGCENIDNNLIRLEKSGQIYFENKISICSSCNSTYTVKNGIYEGIFF